MVHYEPVKVTIDTPGEAEVILLLFVNHYPLYPGRQQEESGKGK